MIILPVDMEQDTDKIKERLKKVIVKLFGISDDEFFEKLLEYTSMVDLDVGHVLFEKGDQSEEMYILISGRLQAMVSQNDVEKVVGEIRVGETVGEMALITAKVRSAKVIAIRDSILLKISKTSFKKLVREYPNALWNLTKLVINRLDQTINQDDHHMGVTNLTFVDLCPDRAMFDSFIQKLLLPLKQKGKVKLVNQKLVASKLGYNDTGHNYDKSNHNVTAWLSDQERSHEFLVLATDAVDDSWTKRCIRQADRIVLVGTPETMRRQTVIEKKLLSGDDKLSIAEQEMVLLYDSNQNPEGTKEILNQRTVAKYFHINTSDDRDFARLTRQMVGDANGLVLSGGGAKGHAHVGIIRALEENNVPIDYVGGTSIGSIIAGLLAQNLDANSVNELAREMFMSNPTPRNEYNFIPLFSLISGIRLEKLLSKYFGNFKIEDLWIPFYCISSNLTKAKMHIHEEGYLEKAIRASISLPGVFPPTIMDQSLLVDGAIFNNFPVDIMVAKKLGKIIAISLDSKTKEHIEFLRFPSKKRYFLDRILKRNNDVYSDMPTLMQTIVQSTLVNSDALSTVWRSSIDLFFNPNVSDYGLMDWKSYDKIVEIGYKHGLDVLSKTEDLKRFQ